MQPCRQVRCTPVCLASDASICLHVVGWAVARVTTNTVAFLLSCGPDFLSFSTREYRLASPLATTITLTHAVPPFPYLPPPPGCRSTGTHLHLPRPRARPRPITAPATEELQGSEDDDELLLRRGGPPAPPAFCSPKYRADLRAFLQQEVLAAVAAARQRLGLQADRRGPYALEKLVYTGGWAVWDGMRCE